MIGLSNSLVVIIIIIIIIIIIKSIFHLFYYYFVGFLWFYLCLFVGVCEVSFFV